MLRDVEIPAIGEHDVLVSVQAAGVNPLDVLIAHGDVRLLTPYQFPLTMGNEMAGTVERVGHEVTGFRPGDRVFARLPTGRIGAFAEYVAVPANALALIPNYLSFREAAAVPPGSPYCLPGSRFVAIAAGRQPLHFRRVGKSRSNSYSLGCSVRPAGERKWRRA